MTYFTVHRQHCCSDWIWKYAKEFKAYKTNQNEWFLATDRFMVDYSIHNFSSWPNECPRSLLRRSLERLKNVCVDESQEALLRQPHIGQFFGIRTPINSSSSDSSYSSESAESSFTGITSLASDLSGDTILSIGMLSDSEFSVGESDESLGCSSVR